ncbi:MAG: tryptophan-rich sensory protein [Firmicutes bacterium]|nr:tryptophan-rich sensory protein [Bacillota bacterium]
MDSSSWYSKLKKPKWSPPGWLFGPVWSVLYIIIIVSFGTVFYNITSGKLPAILALPFALNLIFNFLFTPLQFALKSNVLAAIDIVLVLITLIWALAGICPVMPWIAYVNIPYLLWVLFAAALQISITLLNINKEVT